MEEASAVLSSQPIGVIDPALADHGDSLKESVIGMEVFDRPADYDPQARFPLFGSKSGGCGPG